MKDTNQIETLMKRFRQVLILRGFIEAVLAFPHWKTRRSELLIGPQDQRIEKVIEEKRQLLGVSEGDAFALYLELSINEIMKHWIDEVSR